MTYDAPRGMRDYLPDETLLQDRVESRVRATFESFGYRRLRTPVVEKFELLAARAGDEVRDSMFTFVTDREECALRPEITAPLCRLAASGKFRDAGLPLPHRLYYIGRCFRYFPAASGRLREMTQVGVEMFGARGAEADAEIIALAYKTANAAGGAGCALKIGHAGILKALLETDSLPDADRRYELLSDLSDLQRLRGLLHETKAGDKTMVKEFKRLTRDGKRLGLYTPEFSGGDPAEDPEKALDFMENVYTELWRVERGLGDSETETLIALSGLSGTPEEVLNKARELTGDIPPAAAALDELGAVCERLEDFGVTGYAVFPAEVRGYNYYTGIVFQVESKSRGRQAPLGGGGRYDRLVGELGGPETPAAGFAFSLERLCECAAAGEQMNDEPKPLPAADVFLSGDDMKQVVKAAGELRRAGLRTITSLGAADASGSESSGSPAASITATLFGEKCRLQPAGGGAPEEIATGKIVETIRKKISGLKNS